MLVGTTSIEKSERLSAILQRKGVKHVVLNAKQHEREAEYVAQAGKPGMVTIATNMAGRGTDILLGGNPEFMARQELVKSKDATGASKARAGSTVRAPSTPWRLLVSCASTTRARNLKSQRKIGRRRLKGTRRARVANTKM